MPERHIHRWRIPEPDGSAWLEGVCRGCGARRQFPASEEAYLERRYGSADAGWSWEIGQRHTMTAVRGRAR